MTDAAGRRGFLCTTVTTAAVVGTSSTPASSAAPSSSSRPPRTPPACEPTSPWRAFARDLNRAGRMASDAGLKLGYHNHNWEFFRLTDNPRTDGL